MNSHLYQSATKLVYQARAICGLLCLGCNFAFGQITIDSFVNIYPVHWDEAALSPEAKAAWRAGGAAEEGVFVLMAVIPVISACEEFAPRPEAVECTAKKLAQIFSKHFDASAIHDATPPPKAVKCRLQLGKTGETEAIEVLSEVEESIKQEIISVMNYTGKDYRWSAQKARSRVLGVNVYFTIDIQALIAGD